LSTVDLLDLDSKISPYPIEGLRPGVQGRAKQENQAEKDPMVAALLCAFLGFVGGHRYYLGTEFKICIFYALLSLIGVGFILITIDFVMLIMAGLNKSDMKAYINNPKLIMWKGQL